VSFSGVSEAAVRRPDPRLYQIGALAGLLVWGLSSRLLDVTPGRAALLLASALFVQYAATRIWRLPFFEPKSALISGLSLCLLLRTDSDAIAIGAAAAAISSKFLLRWKGKHLFNPTNFGIVAGMVATGRVWVSPAQWGNAAFFGFLLACAGILVVHRAARSDVTFAFLAVYVGLLIARSAWLGEPAGIPLHRLQNGALLLFAFFMISDPRTTPDSRPGRILFGALVALGAAYVQFRLFRTNGLLWSLAAFSLAVPLIDRILPGRRYAWTGNTAGLLPAKGDLDETLDPPRLLPGLLGGEPAGPPVLRVLRGEGGRPTL
jgi:Na+-transporting NADH:ubiquinone oxidoreductase subunit NqrB